ncbi:hypothetical protein ACIF83_10295 [Streptomyces sp. NPDC085866]|uniref:hypothetical protein n=1 Tax=Streptomyces sp. NPDC085866 TaxID=3365736 RepID=UPI0037D970D1
MLDWPKIHKIAESVAQRVAAEYPGIEAEDIRQEVLLYVLENRSTYENADYPEGQLRKNFRKRAVRYAGRERYAYIYHSAEYVYTASEVRSLFENAFFQPEMWEKAPTKDDGISVTSGGTVVALWDLDRAYSALALADAEVIAKRYEMGETLTPAEAMRLSRAVDKVTRFLNNGVVKRQEEAKAHEGPGPRRIGATA